MPAAPPCGGRPVQPPRCAGFCRSLRQVRLPLRSVESKDTPLGTGAAAFSRTCWAFSVLSHLWAEGQVAGSPGGV